MAQEISGDEPGNVSEAVGDVFSSYCCHSVGRGKIHPGDISEAASLSAIKLPKNSYPLWDSIPDSIIDEGKLSRLQLEGIKYACSKHLEWLPSGERAGFFIGDGAGVGKGRQISGIVLDNYARGRRRHLWVSTSGDLHADAVRDLRDLGCHMPIISNCQELDRETRAAGLSKDFQEGVLFATYSTIIGAAKGRPRLQQIVDWLCGQGGDPATFDGCIIFDECHKAKNFAAGKEGQSTKVSLAVIELQRLLPSARVVYCSATGVSEVGHMAYMPRMGLWGPGSAFRDFDGFLSSLKKRGVTFMEMLAMEMKAEGKYVARGLSFRDAEFCEVACQLTEEQTVMYNDAVDLWADLRASLGEALVATGAPPGIVWRTFWGVFQRFFKLLCISCKVPTIVQEAKEAVEEGFCVVIGLQTTGEAAAEALRLEPGEECGWVSPTREMLLRFIGEYFPTAPPQPPASAQQQQQQGALQPPSDDPVWLHNKAALLERVRSLKLPPNFLDEILHELGGPSSVAEMTGRRGRVVVGSRGAPTFQLRAASAEGSALESLNIQETANFNAGKKLVAVISDAASTGISLHACPRFKNHRRRVHLTIELPWSADKAIQQLGRTHRSNQVTGPLYKLMISNLGGEQRFAAAVARRLQSLGALTRGDRRAASGVDLSSSNLDSPLGRRALRRMYDNIVMDSQHLPPGVVLAAVLGQEVAEQLVRESAKFAVDPSEAEKVAIQRLHAELRDSAEIMGIGLESSSSGPGSKADTTAEAAFLSDKGGGGANGDVRRFLNRLLGLPVDRQNLLFSYLSATLAAETRIAIQEGRYSEGFSDLSCSSYTLDRTSVFCTDPHSGLETIRNDFTLDRGVSYQEALTKLELERANPNDKSGFYQMRRQMYGAHPVMLALQKPGQSGHFSAVRPNTGVSYLDMTAEDLADKYRPCADADAAEELWTAQFTDTLEHCMHGHGCVNGASCQVGRRLSEVTILSGTVVRIWGALEACLERSSPFLSKGDRVMRVVRLQLGAGREDAAAGGTGGGGGSGSLVGVRYPRTLLPEALAVIQTAQSHESAAAAGLVGAGAAAAHASVRPADPATPVDAKALSKALRPPRTIHSFFKASAAAPAEKNQASQQPDLQKGAPRNAPLKESVANGAQVPSTQASLPWAPKRGLDKDRAAPAAAEPKRPKTASPDPRLLQQLLDMGFQTSAAEKALRQANGNLDRAVNVLLSGA